MKKKTFPTLEFLHTTQSFVKLILTQADKYQDVFINPEITHPSEVPVYQLSNCDYKSTAMTCKQRMSEGCLSLNLRNYFFLTALLIFYEDCMDSVHFLLEADFTVKHNLL